MTRMPDAVDPTRQVTFLSVGADDREVAAYVLESLPELNRVVRRELLVSVLRTLPMLLGMIGVVWWLLSRQAPDIARFAPVAAGVFAVPILLYTMNAGPWRRHQRELRQRASAADAKAAERRSVRIEADGIRYDRDGQAYSIVWPWKAFEDVVRLPNHVAFILADYTGGIAVPVSELGGSDAAETWRESLANRLEASGYSRRSRIAAVLDTASATCGVCGYSLRALKEPTCPECGTVLNGQRMHSWRMLQTPIWRLCLTASRQQ